MSTAATVPTGASVDDFINAVDSPVRQKDAWVIKEMMERLSGCQAVMWGPSIIGFDQYDYTYDSGHSGTSMLVGFSPRKTRHSFYFMPGYGTYDEIIGRLGKIKTGAACVYVNKLADIDMDVLEELTDACIKHMRATYKA